MNAAKKFVSRASVTALTARLSEGGGGGGGGGGGASKDSPASFGALAAALDEVAAATDANVGLYKVRARDYGGGRCGGARGGSTWGGAGCGGAPGGRWG